jgi:hypothetical protein
MGQELARRRPSPAQKAVEARIRVIRGKQVIPDSDLAAFYGVETRRLTEQMKRNEERYPEDFVFQLSAEEKPGQLPSTRCARRTPRKR